MRAIVWTLALGILAGSLLCASAAAQDSDRPVISYFRERPQPEWRIFDPKTGADTLFWRLGGETKFVYWDTTMSYVMFVQGNVLHRLDWAFDAQPWPLARFPEGQTITDWWLDPDSTHLHVTTVTSVWGKDAAGKDGIRTCISNLWQSDPAGRSWRVTRSDTSDLAGDCGGSACCLMRAVTEFPGVARRPMIGLERLRESLTMDGWGGPLEGIPPPEGEGTSRFGWYFIPLRSDPSRGVALRLGHHGRNRVGQLPFYLVDRRRGTQRMLDTPYLSRNAEAWRSGFAEHDGFLLFTGYQTYVYDPAGNLIFTLLGSFKIANWVKRPAPAHVDSLGLRRLRDRFR